MEPLLYLVHRLPYPPDKGDKVRSYHLLRHLQRRHRVFLGTFLDDPADEAHLPALRAMCPDLYVARIDPRWRKLWSLNGLLSGEALSLAYYQHNGLRQWVRRVAAEQPLVASVVFSSTMAPYAQALQPRVPMVVDLVDVDSAKWAQYADQHRWPMSWLYRREARCLLAHERRVAQEARRTFLVTAQEVELFNTLAPECCDRVQAVGNGVDAEFFRPDVARPSPFAHDEQAMVFTGAMDYWPNVDAVQWFVRDMLPCLRASHPRARLWIVGRNPSAAVRALAGEAVRVTGTVPDVRPYLQHAAAVVAPLRVARGIQNKILEAMAMGQPVVTVPSCAQAIGAGPKEGLATADAPVSFANAVAYLLSSPDQRAALGRHARGFVQQCFTWPAQLRAFDAVVAAGGGRAPLREVLAHG